MQKSEIKPAPEENGISKCIEKLLHYRHFVIFATSLNQASDQDSNQDPSRDQDLLSV